MEGFEGGEDLCGDAAFGVVAAAAGDGDGGFIVTFVRSAYGVRDERRDGVDVACQKDGRFGGGV